MTPLYDITVSHIISEKFRIFADDEDFAMELVAKRDDYKRLTDPSIISTNDITPSFLKDDHLSYLDKLRNEGSTNMFGVVPLLYSEFQDLTKKQCTAILTHWRMTFELRHPPDHNCEVC